MACFSDVERINFSELLCLGFVDSYRKLNPKIEKYSWWSY